MDSGYFEGVMKRIWWWTGHVTWEKSKRTPSILPGHPEQYQCHLLRTSHCSRSRFEREFGLELLDIIKMLSRQVYVKVWGSEEIFRWDMWIWELSISRWLLKLWDLIRSPRESFEYKRYRKGREEKKKEVWGLRPGTLQQRSGRWEGTSKGRLKRKKKKN